MRSAHGIDSLRVRLLDGVDVEVAGAGVLAVALGHRLEPRQQLLGAGLRLVVLGPVVPAAQQHDRLGGQHLGVGIVRISVRHLGHRAGVGRVAARALGGRVRSVAERHRLDVGALFVTHAARPRQRPLGRGVRLGAAGRVHGGVDVRPGRPGDPPRAHGAGGIEALRLRARTFL